MAGTHDNAARTKLHTQQGQLSLSIYLDEDHIIQTAQDILQQRFNRLTEPLESVEQVKGFLLMQLVPRQREALACLFLDSKHRLITFETLFEGSLDYAAIHPREVVKRALQLNAGAVIAAHNHPSGDAQPSQADVDITLKLQQALNMVGIRLLDHLIFGAEHMVSLKEQQLF